MRSLNRPRAPCSVLCVATRSFDLGVPSLLAQAGSKRKNAKKQTTTKTCFCGFGVVSGPFGHHFGSIWEGFEAVLAPKAASGASFSIFWGPWVLLGRPGGTNMVSESFWS